MNCVTGGGFFLLLFPFFFFLLLYISWKFVVDFRLCLSILSFHHFHYFVHSQLNHASFLRPQCPLYPCPVGWDCTISEETSKKTQRMKTGVANFCDTCFYCFIFQILWVLSFDGSNKAESKGWKILATPALYIWILTE